MLRVYHGATARVECPLCSVGRPNRSDYRCLRFEAYDEAWLNFIVQSRKGMEPWKEYDFIEGGVADDRVVDTVNLYLLGLMTADVALGRLAQHLPNNQMCLISQPLVDKCVRYLGSESLNDKNNRKECQP